ncbi:MAG: zf-HC2 domain-containing protein [Actinobacteria bacterium]|nr:zf-HC2 domain-containing protein [Actinomycetota bacterium]
MRKWFGRWRRGGEASCAEVAQVLQSYLDGRVDDLTARRVRRHLEHCRRCGLEAETYEAIKAALARRSHQVDTDALQRLRAFAQRLGEQGPAGTSTPMS